LLCALLNSGTTVAASINATEPDATAAARDSRAAATACIIPDTSNPTTAARAALDVAVAELQLSMENPLTNEFVDGENAAPALTPRKTKRYEGGSLP